MDKKRLEEFKKKSSWAGDLQVQRGLAKIYSNKDGDLPDISHLEVKRRKRWKMVLFATVALVLFLSLISWVGFIIFNPGHQAQTKSIGLDIQGPRNIASGDELTYVLEYKNLDKVSLNDLELIVRYPEGFEF